jgi:cytoskeletal protein CcmA (bactofilin family)
MALLPNTPISEQLNETGKPYQPAYREVSTTEKRRSVLQEGIHINGDWSGDGIVEFSGTIVGDITVDTLVLTRTGHVTGTVRASHVIIEGTLIGLVQAKKLQVKHTAILQAKIYATTISVDTGAQLEGEIKMNFRTDV